MPIARQKAVFEGKRFMALSIMPTVKHSFTHDVKHCSIDSRFKQREDKAMLKDKQTTEEREAFKSRLKEAISTAPSKTYIANACGINRQAVNGWLVTGNIDKSHLAVVAKISGYELYWIITGEGPKLSRDLIDRRIFANAVRLVDAFISKADYPLKSADRADIYWRIYQILLAKEYLADEELGAVIESIVRKS
jgi:hypothetical protein